MFFRIKVKAILERFIHIIVNFTNYETAKWSRQSNFRKGVIKSLSVFFICILQTLYRKF